MTARKENFTVFQPASKGQSILIVVAPTDMIITILNLLMSMMTSTTSAPAKSPYGAFEGTLYQYSGSLVAFESNPQATNKCILLGGLSDGLIPTPYTKPLEEACKNLGWSLVQPLISSSHTGFGHGNLERDTSELDALIVYLTNHQNAKHVALVGHSTGCQNSVHYLKHGKGKDMIAFLALQAPVSDREDAQRSKSTYKSNMRTAEQMAQNGKADEMMPRSCFWAPITAKRFLDLQQKGGLDDYFSSDFTDEEMTERLGHIGKAPGLTAVLVVYSGADEYVPPEIDTLRLTERLCEAINVSKEDVAIPLYLPHANHNLSESPGDAQIFVNRVAELLQKCTIGT
jgi:pimeloyl-ACP methyl ester carboxylesterase